MTWGAVAVGAGTAIAGVAGAQGQKAAANPQMVRQMMDPNMYQMLYGTGAEQARFYKGGGVKDPGSPGTGGLLQSAQGLASEPALNPVQSEALKQLGQYYGSPESLAGYNALNQTGNQLSSFANPYNASGLPQVALKGSAPTVNAAQGQVANPNLGNPIDFLAIQSAVARAFAPQPITGGSAGGTGIDYKGAANRALSGQVDNPYLQSVAEGSARLSTDNFLRSVAPQLRGGAQMAGQFGSSRAGVMEGIAASDLNRDILNSTNQLFSGSYESAQNRASSMAGQLAGIDAQTQIANAQLQQQAQLANQAAQLQAAQLGLGTASAMGQYGLGYGGLGLEAAGLQQQGSFQNANLLQNAGLANQGAALDWARLGLSADQSNQSGWLQGQGLNLQGQELAGRQQLAGAAALQDASGIPAANLRSLYDVGTIQQQAPWGQLGQFANLLYPQAQLGQATTGTQQTKQSTSPAQTALGLAAMGIGAYTGNPGMMEGGLGGLFGGGGLQPIDVGAMDALRVPGAALDRINTGAIGSLYRY